MLKLSSDFIFPSRWTTSQANIASLLDIHGSLVQQSFSNCGEGRVSKSELSMPVLIPSSTGNKQLADCPWCVGYVWGVLRSYSRAHYLYPSPHAILDNFLKYCFLKWNLSSSSQSSRPCDIRQHGACVPNTHLRLLWGSFPLLERNSAALSQKEIFVHYISLPTLISGLPITYWATNTDFLTFSNGLFILINE